MDWRAVLREDLARLAPGEHMSKVTLTLFRLSQGLADPGFGPLRHLLGPLVFLAKFVWVELLMGATLQRQTQIGPGLRLPHGGRGVMIHPYARIGRNATIFEWVSVGAIEELDDRGNASYEFLQLPVIGDDVYIGYRAAIFGPVHVGDRSRIGIGAVVLKDVPPGSTVMPTPSRVITRPDATAERDAG
jgi:serine acetyltransferase